MKVKVTFRRYEIPNTMEIIDGIPERGEFIASFQKEVEGKTLLEISEIADKMAKDFSNERKEDVRVFEIPMHVGS